MPKGYNARSIMPRRTAAASKPLSLAQRKARLSALVKKGVVTKEQAALIDFRELTDEVRAEARKLVPTARRALARAAQRRAAA